jgi:hypothetical protein
MKCPGCGAAVDWASPLVSCRQCGGGYKVGDLLAVEEVDYLLAELATWSDLLPDGLTRQLDRRYRERRALLLECLAGTGLNRPQRQRPAG